MDEFDFMGKIFDRYCKDCYLDGKKSDICNICRVSAPDITNNFSPIPTEWKPKNILSDITIKKDMVNHPDHYKSETGLETIDVIEAFTFDLKGCEAICTGNVLKYICRWKKKNGLQDLKKAKWYLERLINHVEKLEKENKNEN